MCSSDLYQRPRTRFVAGFIGRTNFLDGTIAGGTIRFPGFSVPAELAPDVAGANGAVSFSVRPHSIGLHRAPPPVANGGWWVQARIAERAYLGEHWEYVVQPAASELRLRVTAAPQAMYEAGDAVWLEIDPARIARVPPEEV